MSDDVNVEPENEPVGTEDNSANLRNVPDLAKPSARAMIAGGSIDPGLISEWEAAGGDEFHLSQAQDAAEAVLGGLDDDDRTDLQADFDGLPEAAQSSITLEISLGEWGGIKPATDAELEQFATLPEGAELIKEWRYKAPRNFAVARKRISSILSRMSEADAETTLDWLEELTTEQARAVLRELAK
ncbi:MAG: hypothetical protein GY789_21665 [Hyphomicrobiales bacterium]|nr:hypothetical protein [Hyphomicrobiales bacterium]